MDRAGTSDATASPRSPVTSRATLLVLGALLGVERLIWVKWDVPVWSVFAYLLLVFALLTQRVLAPTQPLSSALRPLTLIAVAVAVAITVLVVLSWDLPGDKWWVLLVWLVPVAMAGVDRLASRLPPQTLPAIIAGLLAVVIFGQLATIRQAHNRRVSAHEFDDRLAQICADTAILSSDQAHGWTGATDSMVEHLQALTPPDQRTRALTGYLIADLRNALSFEYSDPAKHSEWQESAREDARYLGIDSCGVF